MAQWLHFAYQNHNKEPGILMGLRTAKDLILPGEQAFMMASDLLACEEGYLPVIINSFKNEEEET